MDINKVEVVGHIVCDLDRQQTAAGDVWYVIKIATTGNDKRANIKKAESIPAILSFCVFNKDLVEKVASLKLRKGSYVHVIGQLFAKNYYKKKVSKTFTSIAAIDIELANK